MIDFSRIVSADYAKGNPHPKMSYLRKSVEGRGRFSYQFVIISNQHERITKRYGNRVGVGYDPKTRQIVIASPDSGLTTRTLCIPSTKGNSVGQVSAAFMKDVAKKFYGDHKRVYFDMKWEDNGFIFTPNGKVED